jgi:protein O-mannosyl-transferase
MRRPAIKSKSAPMRATVPAVARPRFPAWLPAVLLALVTVALYWPAASHDFVNYDDDLYVTDNPQVMCGLTWESLKWAWLNPVAANWHPVTVLSHMTDCQVFGLKPWGHHLTNVLLHAFTAALVFALLQQATGARWRSLFVAALFAVHPLRVESVAWVAERKDVLSGCFGLLALIFYTRYAQRSVISNQRPATGSQSPKVAGPNSGPRTRDHRLLINDHRLLFYLLSLFCFALGLMSKPMLVTWPFVMLLLDYWPLGRMQDVAPADTQHPSSVAVLRSVDTTTSTDHVSRFTFRAPPGTLMRLVTEKIPFFVLAALASVMTFVVQQHGGAMKGVENLPLSIRCGNALISYGRYLGKLFWPADLAVFYWHPGHWPPGKVLLTGGMILGLSVLLWLQRRRFPALLVGWLWFLGTLVPVIGLVQVGKQAMADRYTYLPSLGVLILAIWGAHELTRRWRHSAMALSAAGCAAFFLCFALTRQQIGYWTDSETLFRHALAVTGSNYVVQKFLGDALDKKGQLDEAISHYQEALRLKPDDALVYNNLGVAFDKKGLGEDAIRQYREIIRLEPDRPFPHYNLGNALLRKGLIDEAIEQYQEALRLKPDYADAHNNLGNALGSKGQTEAAIEHYRQAIRLKPEDGITHNNLAAALDKLGQTKEAIIQYQEAVRLIPENALVRNNLGAALNKMGRLDEAIGEFQSAVRLKPDYTEAKNNLARALELKNESKMGTPSPVKPRD